MYRLPLSLSGGTAGWGAAGVALCQSPAEQQAERTTWSDFWLLIGFHCQHSCNGDGTFKDMLKQKGWVAKTGLKKRLAGDQDTSAKAWQGAMHCLMLNGHLYTRSCCYTKCPDAGRRIISLLDLNTQKIVILTRKSIGFKRRERQENILIFCFDPRNIRVSQRTKACLTAGECPWCDGKTRGGLTCQEVESTLHLSCGVGPCSDPYHSIGRVEFTGQ